MRHHPYQIGRPPGLDPPPAALLGPAARPPVGLESLGPSPPRPAAQGTDGETPSLPDRQASRPRPSASGPPGPRCPPSGRARVSRAIPTSPWAAQGTDGEKSPLPDRPVAHTPHLKWGILIGAKGRIMVVEHTPSRTARRKLSPFRSLLSSRRPDTAEPHRAASPFKPGVSPQKTKQTITSHRLFEKRTSRRTNPWTAIV